MKKHWRMITLLMLVLTPILVGCEEEDTKTTASDVTVSGTLTFAGWVQGDYYAVAYPDGDPIGPTGELASTFVTGTGTTADYSITLPANSGSVYVFGFNDDDASNDPNGTNDGSACSTAVTVADTAVTGVDITLELAGGTGPGGAFTGCTL